MGRRVCKYRESIYDMARRSSNVLRMLHFLREQQRHILAEVVWKAPRMAVEWRHIFGTKSWKLPSMLDALELWIRPAKPSDAILKLLKVTPCDELEKMWRQ